MTGRLAPYSGRCGLVVLAVVLQVGFRVCVPIGYQAIFDDAIAQDDTRLLLTILFWLMVGWLIHGAAGMAQDYYSAWVSSRAMKDLRERMFRQLQRLSDAYYARVDSGDMMSRFSNDLAVVEQALANGFQTALFSALNLGGSLILLFVIEWRLATLTLGALVGAYMLPRLLSPRARDRAFDRKESEGEVTAAIQESIGAHSMVQAFDLREYVLEKLRVLLEVLAKKTVAAHVATTLVGRAASQSIFFVQILIMVLGGWLAIEGAFSVGALIGFAALLQNVSNASNHLAGVAPELLRASGGVRRVREFLAEEPVDDAIDDATVLPRLAQDIRFEDVSFAYDSSAPLLRRLSFRIRARKTVALVGPSGSGKSTVLGLLLRFRRPDSGAIRFDGTDIGSVQESSLRDQIGIVLQETVLLKASFAENIRLGKLDATDQEIVEAAKLANIHQTILEKPQGYDTIVGEGGRRLSVGQRQRIAIARAILRDPAILVLDEATSALDPAAEEAIHRTLAQVGRGRTVISATHRLNSVVEADRILVFEKGELVEDGRHDDLLRRRGTYYRLWQKQTGFEIEISDEGVKAEVTGTRLMQVPLLSGMTEDSLGTIAERFSSQVIPKDRYIFRQGDLGEAFYIVVKGQVEVLVATDGKEERKAILEDGDFFGELALLDAKPRNASVRTLSSTLMLSLQRQHFERFLERQPALRATIEEKARSRRLSDDSDHLG